MRESLGRKIKRNGLPLISMMLNGPYEISRRRGSGSPGPAARCRGEGEHGTRRVVEMLDDPTAPPINEIIGSMEWQKHTVRGFMAGAMKKAGYEVISFKNDAGERSYRIEA